MKILWQGENYRLTGRAYGAYGFDKRLAHSSEWHPIFLDQYVELRKALIELGQWFEQQGATK